MINALYLKSELTAENSNETRELYDQSHIGTPLEDGRLQLTLLEGLFLLDKKKIKIIDSKGKTISKEDFKKKAQREEKQFSVRYPVFSDLRKRGYIVKTALKFGADFRVYDRGIKPGIDHAKWVVYAVKETSTFTWHEFAAKNRVAHSTKKKLLIGVVDDENDVSYWEVKWLRP